MRSESKTMASREIQRRAAIVRKHWSPEERLARLDLPPDSVLWECVRANRRGPTPTLPGDCSRGKRIDSRSSQQRSLE